MSPNRHKSNLHPRAEEPEYGDWRADLPCPEEAEHYTPRELPAHMHSEQPTGRSLGTGARMLRLFVGLFLLLPLNAIIIYALMLRIGNTSPEMEDVRFWLRTPIWFSILGVLSFTSIALMGVARRTSLYLYVLGHELTHAIAILMCRGKIKGFHVSASHGGYVLTNKSNIFIALAPYFVPFWMIIWMLLIWCMHRISPLSYYLPIFYLGFGFWWAYHIYWTTYSIIQEKQPDLFDNGLLFSLMIIVFINFALLVGILMMFGLITPAGYWQSLVDSFCAAYHYVLHFIG